MGKTKKLPDNIVQDLNNNTAFNRFGLVNISALKARTGTKLSDNELKELIQSRFEHEMSNGRVEFIGEK